MFCSNCGTEAAEGAGFCSSCGRGLASAVATLPERPDTEGITPPPPTDAGAALAAAKAASWNQPEGKPFQHEGEWYARQGHALLRWETASGAWSEARATGGAVPREDFTSLKTPARWLYVLLGLFLPVTVVAVAAGALGFSTFDDAASGQFVSRAERDDALTFFYAMKGFQYLIIIPTAVIFIWWTRRATCNVRALGAANPEFSPGWAIGWWFIPFANWVQPLRVLNQAWRASDPALPNTATDEWRKAKLTPLLPIWWIAWLVGSGLWGAAWGTIDDGTMTNDEVAGLLAFSTVMDVVMLAVTGLTIWVVMALTRRQERAAARFAA